MDSVVIWILCKILSSFEGQVHVSVIRGIAGIDAYVQLSFLKHMSKLSAKL